MKSLALSMMVALSCTAIAQTPDWQSIEKLFGRKGTEKDGMFKITLPRSDVTVNDDGFVVDPGLALTSWIVFVPMGGMHGHQGTGNDVMIMGDLVLLDREVGEVMKKLVTNGLEVTALHNHIVGVSPSIKYMHFEGHGEAMKLAEAMKTVLSATQTPMSARQPTEPQEVDWSKVEAAMKMTGQNKGTLMQFSIPRTEKIMENGMEVLPFAGMATAINFQMSKGKVATTGDFVLLADEVNPVVKALTENGITVTAIHNHMLNETPRLFMLHFWSVGEGERIAQGLRAALDRTNSQKAK
jgi:hypothetical protein